MKRFFLGIFMIQALFLFGQENLDTLLLQTVISNKFNDNWFNENVDISDVFLPISNLSVEILDISKEGKFLLTRSGKVVYIWDMEIKERIRKYPGSRGALLSNDEKLVYTYSKNKLFIWDLFYNKQIRSMILDSRSGSEKLLSTPDNDILVYKSKEFFPKIKSISLSNNYNYKDIPGYILGITNEDDNIFVKRGDSIYILNITNPNICKKLAIPTRTYEKMCRSSDKKWLLSSVKASIESYPYLLYPTELYLTDLENDSEKLIYSFEDKEYFPLNKFSFSPNSIFFGYIEKSGLKIFSLSNLNEHLLLRKNVSSFIFSHSGDTVVIGYNNGLIEYYDLKDLKVIQKIRPKTQVISSSRWFFDGLNSLRIHTNTPTCYKINFRNSKVTSTKVEFPVKNWLTKYNSIGTLALVADTLNNSGNLYLIDMSSETKRAKKIIHYQYGNSFCFSKGHHHVILATNSDLIKYDMKGIEKQRISPFYGPSHIGTFSVSTNEEFIAISNVLSYDSLLYTGKELFGLKVITSNLTNQINEIIVEYPLTSLHFSKDDKYLYAISRNGCLIKYDWRQSIALNKVLIDPEVEYYIWNWSHIVGFDSVGNIYILYTSTSSGISSLKVFECDSLKMIKEVEHNTYRITPSPDWKIFVSSGEGGSTSIWDVNKNRKICSIYFLDSNDFVATTPSGLFDASPSAMDKLYYVAGMETIDLEQLKHRYYQPGLLPILLGYTDEKLREVPPFDYVRLFPKKELKIDNSQLSIDLTNQGGGIGKVSVFIDNIEIIKDARPGGNADSARYEMTIPLDLNDYARYYRYDTTNVIKVVAWNTEGYLSSRPDTIHYIPSSKTAKGVEVVSSAKSFSKPHLYGLVVGTSDYAGNEIDLQYAAKDATAFHEALTLGAKRLFDEENVSVSLLSTEIPGQEPTLDNIFRQLMEMREARPDDIVVVYFSGHGVNYGGQDGEFYYLTMTADGADAAYLNDPMVRKYRTISSQDLAFELNQIPARKKVLILDACSSGQAANNLLASLKDIPSSQKRALEFTQDATGSHILASSAPNSVSYETNIYRQGLLTYALLKGMRGGQLKKIEEGEFIDVEQLLQYAKAEVPSLAKSFGGTQEPIYRIPQGTSFIIGQMMEEDKEKIQLAEPRPVFISSIFMNSDLGGEDIDLAAQIDSQLDQLASKGSQPEIQFVRNASNYPDAYCITGNYIIKGKNIDIKYILKKRDQKICKPQVESGRVDNINQVIESLIKKIVEMIQY